MNVKPMRMFRVFMCDWGDGEERGPEARGTLTICERQESSLSPEVIGDMSKEPLEPSKSKILAIYVADCSGERRQFDVFRVIEEDSEREGDKSFQCFEIQCLLHRLYSGPDKYRFTAYKEIGITGDVIRTTLVRAVTMPGARSA